MLMSRHGISDLLMRVVRLFMPVAAILTESVLDVVYEAGARGSCLPCVISFSWMGKVINAAMLFEKHDCLR